MNITQIAANGTIAQVEAAYTMVNDLLDIDYTASMAMNLGRLEHRYAALRKVTETQAMDVLSAHHSTVLAKRAN